MNPENKSAACSIRIAQVSQDAERPIAQSNKATRIVGKNKHITIESVYDEANLRAAERDARRNKKPNYGVKRFDKNYDENINRLKYEISTRTFRTSTPRNESVWTENKIRALSKVNYFDNVAHHALMRVINPVLLKYYYYESASSIKGRGIHYAAKHVRKYIDINKNKDIWWCPIDFVKFYHFIKRDKMYNMLCHTFNDDGIRYLLHDVIYALGDNNGLGPSDGNTGLGIGLTPVQSLVNYYTSPLARIVSKIEGVKLFIYCDNFLIIGFSPAAVWKAVNTIKEYATNVMEQPLHENIGVQKLDETHPIDFVGYLFYKDHTLIRKQIKYNFKKKYYQTIGTEKHRQVLASYKGWLQHADALHLWNKVTGMKKFSELNISVSDTSRNGERFFEVPTISASFIVNREIVVLDFIENVSTKNGEGRMCILIEENNSKKKILTNNPRLKDILIKAKEMDALPFSATFRSRQICGSKIDYYFE